MKRGLLLLMVCCANAAGSGCASRVAVKGEVTLDGQAVGPGNIAFYPEPGTESRPASAAIIDGKYEIEPSRLPGPGTFKVHISWSKKTGRQIPSADPGFMMDEVQEIIPSRYNVETTLIETLAVGDNVKDFHLMSR
jgi:hypothetical protein